MIEQEDETVSTPNGHHPFHRNQQLRQHRRTSNRKLDKRKEPTTKHIGDESIFKEKTRSTSDVNKNSSQANTGNSQVKQSSESLNGNQSSSSQVKEVVTPSIFRSSSKTDLVAQTNVRVNSAHNHTVKTSSSSNQSRINNNGTITATNVQAQGKDVMKSDNTTSSARTEIATPTTGTDNTTFSTPNITISVHKNTAVTSNNIKSSRRGSNSTTFIDIKKGDIISYYYDGAYGWLISKVLGHNKHRNKLHLLFYVDCAAERQDFVPKRIRILPSNQGGPNSTDFTTKCGQKYSDNPTNTSLLKKAIPTPDGHTVAGLNCDRYGGPSEEIAAEMVYWRDIPSDSDFLSKFHQYKNLEEDPKYLVFEAETGGWNNVRMSMETAVVLAVAMGRILVMPPTWMYQDKKNSNKHMSFHDFFHFDSILNEHNSSKIFDMITTKELIQREGLTGKLNNKYTKQVDYPPGGGTEYSQDDFSREDYDFWLRNVSYTPLDWNYHSCVIIIPDGPGQEAVDESLKLKDQIKAHRKQYDDTEEGRAVRPIINVYAPAIDRLVDVLGARKETCVYDTKAQNEKVLDFMFEDDTRLLSHYYTYVMFQNWVDDVWMKRFVRDHLRYNDEIQCASARIVHAMRQKAIENGNPNGEFDTFHIRRGDFEDAYEDSFVTDPMHIYETLKDVLPSNATIFIATNERNLSFFNPLKQFYHIYFLNDFKDLIKDLSNNHYLGMIDQRVASRGRIFAGAYMSTFTGYIYRIRGYHAQKDKADGSQYGQMPTSYFYAPDEHRDDMIDYTGVYGPFWAREFPQGWRDIDFDIQ